MKKIFVFLVFLLILVGFSQSAYGYGSIYKGGMRALGMGGAYTAVADDGNATYWNPAGITQHQFNAYCGVGWPLYETAALQLGEDNYGVSFENIAFTSNSWYFSTNYVDIETGYTTEYFYYNNSQTTLAAMINPVISIGLNINRIDYIEEDFYYKTGEPGQTIVRVDLRGSAFDLGILYKLADSKLKLGFVARNIAGQLYGRRKERDGVTYIVTTSQVTKELKKSYVAGLAYEPNNSSIYAADFELYEDGQCETRIGMEYDLSTTVSLRLGMFYETERALIIPTCGISLNFGNFKIDTVYTSENGCGLSLQYLIK